MRGVSPSQTLPGAGGQPPTPPGSVSPLHHDQRPALDPLIHRAGIHKTNSQTSPPRRRPGPAQRPITASRIKPHMPGHNHRRELQAQTIAAAIQKAQGRPQRRPTRGGPLRLVPHTRRAAPARSQIPASARPAHAAMPAGLRGTPAEAPHGSFLARSAPRLPQPGPRATGHRHAPPRGGPALHPRPRFARPRPPLGPPYRCIQSDDADRINHPQIVR